jgi:hypothetical protein
MRRQHEAAIPVRRRSQQQDRCWRSSEGTVRNQFQHEPGILAIEGIGKFTGKQKHVFFTIPESVARRVYIRLTQPTQKPVTKKPAKPIKLRDLVVAA